MMFVDVDGSNERAYVRTYDVPMIERVKRVRILWD